MVKVFKFHNTSEFNKCCHVIVIFYYLLSLCRNSWWKLEKAVCTFEEGNWQFGKISCYNINLFSITSSFQAIVAIAVQFIICNINALNVVVLIIWMKKKRCSSDIYWCLPYALVTNPVTRQNWEIDHASIVQCVSTKVLWKNCSSCSTLQIGLVSSCLDWLRRNYFILDTLYYFSWNFIKTSEIPKHEPTIND